MGWIIVVYLIMSALMIWEVSWDTRNNDWDISLPKGSIVLFGLTWPVWIVYWIVLLLKGGN